MKIIDFFKNPIDLTGKKVKITFDNGEEKICIVRTIMGDSLYPSQCTLISDKDEINMNKLISIDIM